MEFATSVTDAIARRCDARTSSRHDLQDAGPREALDAISVADALRACAQAAEPRPVRAPVLDLPGTLKGETLRGSGKPLDLEKPEDDLHREGIPTRSSGGIQGVRHP
jgi:hypothetical protein